MKTHLLEADMYTGLSHNTGIYSSAKIFVNRGEPIKKVYKILQTCSYYLVDCSYLTTLLLTPTRNCIEETYLPDFQDILEEMFPSYHMHGMVSNDNNVLL